MMAIINGVQVTGTPSEIAELIAKLNPTPIIRAPNTVTNPIPPSVWYTTCEKKEV